MTGHIQFGLPEKMQKVSLSVCFCEGPQAGGAVNRARKQPNHVHGVNPRQRTGAALTWRQRISASSCPAGCFSCLFFFQPQL